jgi:hypothetical protein
MFLMLSLLVRVKNKEELESLNQYGTVTYISPFTNLIGFDCFNEKYNEFINDENVDFYENAITGELLFK